MIIWITIGFILLLLYGILLMFLRNAWGSIPDYKPDSINAMGTTTVSVIIPARNEATGITNLLKSLAEQQYPLNLIEFIVIDDCSTDATAELVKQFKLKNLKLLSLQDINTGKQLNSYKKKAIEYAIQESTGHLIICTDADCVVPNTWISTLVNYYEKFHPKIIAGPVMIEPNGRFLGFFQAMDFMSLQGVTGAAVQANLLSMCNGANLAYERLAFEFVDGFKHIDDIASGDDMLLMHKINRAFPGKALFIKSNDCMVTTKAEKSWGDFLNQRIRWASKSGKYNDQRILPVLILIYLLNVWLLFFPIFVYSINGLNKCWPQSMNYWLAVFAGKILLEIIFLIPVLQFYKKLSWILLFPFLQPFHVFYTVMAGWLGKFGSYRWKGRSVK